MWKKPIILVFLIFIFSNFVATYFVGVASSWALLDPGNLYCFCWDMCLVPFYQRLILVIIETFGFIIFFKSYFNWNWSKSISISIIFSFGLEYILFQLDVLGTLIYHQNLEILDLMLPIHLLIGRTLIVCIFIALLRIIFRKRIT